MDIVFIIIASVIFIAYIMYRVATLRDGHNKILNKELYKHWMQKKTIKKP